jgi:hypothetical protein
MKHPYRWISLLTAGLALALLLGPQAVADRATAEAEGVTCTVCHDKPGSKRMTDRGKYFEIRGTLEDYDQVVEVFGKCTACHSKKPGSLKLTRTGRRFQKVVEDMDGLASWLRASHPCPPFQEGDPIRAVDGSLHLDTETVEVAPAGDAPRR